MVSPTSSGQWNQQEASPSLALGTFFRQGTQDTDEFIINPAYDQHLTDHSGTRWFIPKRTLRDRRGDVPGKDISIRISSISDPREALLSGYTISSGERPLQTRAFFSIQAGLSPHNYQITQPVIVSHAERLKTNGLWSIYTANPSNIISNHQNGMLSWKKLNQGISPFKFGRKKSMELSIPATGVYALAQQLPARLSQTMLTVRAYGLPVSLDHARAFLLLDTTFPPIQLHQTAPLDFTGFNLPSGRAAWLLVVGNREEQFFYGLHRLSALYNRVESIALRPIPPKQLREVIQNILL